jgi:LysR family transcriptional activator of nhaA
VEWLNYHHLLYFWTVARTGSIARASEELRLSQPTISNQLKTLESSLGVRLFERQGRRLALTDVGHTAMRYADEIFRTGRELQLALKGLPTGERVRLVAGVADVIPKLVAERLLAPALKVEKLTLVCREGRVPQLLAALALHELDVVLSDAPATETVKVRAYSHRLGDCGVSFVAAPALAGLRRRFPASLDQAPFLMPADGTSLRRNLERWLEERALRPAIVGEFDDSALLNAFGSRGLGAFAIPSVIEAEVCDQFDVQPLGRVDELRESYYAITVDRRLRHPAVVAVAEAARDETFRSAR